MVRCWCSYLSGARCRLAHAQLMPLPLTISCSSEIQIGFTFLVPAHPGCPGKRAVKRVCVCVCVSWQRIVFAVAETDHHHHRCQCQCCWTHSECVSMCTGVELSVCEAWSRGSRRRSRERHHGDAPLSCCTRQMEARLSTHARHELSRLLTEQLDDVRHDFSNADAQFQSRPQHQTCIL